MNEKLFKFLARNRADFEVVKTRPKKFGNFGEMGVLAILRGLIDIKASKLFAKFGLMKIMVHDSSSYGLIITWFKRTEKKRSEDR